MRIRWTPAAADDLEHIAKYLQENCPTLARSTVLELYDAAQSLKQFANRGRIGRIAGHYGCCEVFLVEEGQNAA